MHRKSTPAATATAKPPRAKVLRHVLGAFARLLERAVPATPPHSDPPPEIRFPYF